MIPLELLAPARNADIGIAAIDCGADAVYIAGPEFGARQDAGNSMEDVRRLCAYAHRFGVRIFLTLNTILYDSELSEAERILREAAEAGVDAVIAQDLAVFGMLRGENEILRCAQDDRSCHSEEQDGRGCHSEEAARPMKNLQVHASTQCAIRTPEQARFYESLGASRLVLERQLSLDQLRAIRDAVSCELEFFVHGALCVCYSGNCYMSEAVAGRSANRGACVQACRSLYDLEDGDGRKLLKNKALLSLKDYNLIGRLGDLADAGVCSFKIEGRLKNISYVRNVVLAYSKALDRLVEAHPEKYRRASFGKVEGGFRPDLGKTFNRGYTELFLDGRRGKWSSMDAPKSVGEPIGTVVRIIPSSTGARKAPHPDAKPVGTPAMMQVYLDFDNPATALHNGDGFSFVSKDRNEIIGFRGDMCRGAMINSRYVPELFVGARLRRNLSAAFEKEMEANLPARHVPVAVSMTITTSTVPASAAAVSPRFASYPGKCSPAAALPHTGSVSEADSGPGRVHSRFAAAEYGLSPDQPRRFVISVVASSEDGRTVEFEVEAGNQEAANRERMEAMFRSQIGKTAGIYSFTLERLDSGAAYGKLPFMSASALNAIRREIARRLDGIPCGRRPFAPLRVTSDTPRMTSDTPRVTSDIPRMTESDAIQKGQCHSERSEGSAPERFSPITETIDYKSNISNSVAREILRKLGAGSIEDAYELSHSKGAELMRSKYCIRHELGLCLKGGRTGADSSASGLRMTGGKHKMTGEGHGMAQEGGRTAPGPLFLINNGRRYRLGFDCPRCEMTVSEA